MGRAYFPILKSRISATALPLLVAILVLGSLKNSEAQATWQKEWQQTVQAELPRHKARIHTGLKFCRYGHTGRPEYVLLRV